MGTAFNMADKVNWKDHEVELLLDIFAEETIQFSLEKAKCPKDKNAVYNEVKVKLESQDICKTVAAITTKLKKLRAKYKTQKDKLKKSGTSRPKKPWKFFDKLDRIFKDNPSIQPRYLFDSSKEGEKEYRVLDPDENSDTGEDEEGSCQESAAETPLESHSVGGEGELALSASDNNRKRTQHITGVTPKPKKTKIEKSMETVCSSIMQSSEAEMKRYEEIEERRHERELKYRLELQKLESDRRREERQHEINIMQILMQTRGFNTVPFAGTQQYGNSTPSNSSYSTDGDNTYFQM